MMRPSTSPLGLLRTSILWPSAWKYTRWPTLAPTVWLNCPLLISRRSIASDCRNRCRCSGEGDWLPCWGLVRMAPMSTFSYTRLAVSPECLARWKVWDHVVNPKVRHLPSTRPRLRTDGGSTAQSRPSTVDDHPGSTLRRGGRSLECRVGLSSYRTRSQPEAHGPSQARRHSRTGKVRLLQKRLAQRFLELLKSMEPAVRPVDG